MKIKVNTDKLVLIGDVHGEFAHLRQIVNKIPDDCMIVQVGDFGFWPQLEDLWYKHRPDRPIHFIDGNHEYFPLIPNTETITETWSNLYYIPRGTELVFPNGKNAVLMGGGDSIDYKMRQLGVDWFKEEEVTEQNIKLVHANVFETDLLVTHSPPQTTVFVNFDQDGLNYRFGVDKDWVSISNIRIEKLWTGFNKPQLICGHMHKPVLYGNVRILDILEVYEHKWES